MAKGLPYFQFETSAWDNGNIQMCTREEKGLFIDICSMYWSRLGNLPYKLVLQKLCAGNANALRSLCDSNIIVEIEGNLSIKFLDIQLEDRGAVSKTNSKTAKDAWLKRKQKQGIDTNALRTQSERITNAMPIEENRIEENREKSKLLWNYLLGSKQWIDPLIMKHQTNTKLIARSLKDFFAIQNLIENPREDAEEVKKHFGNWLKTNPPEKAKHSHEDLLQGEWGVDFHLQPTPNYEEEVEELLKDGWVRTKDGMAKRIKPIV